MVSQFVNSTLCQGASTQLTLRQVFKTPGVFHRHMVPILLFEKLQQVYLPMTSYIAPSCEKVYMHGQSRGSHKCARQYITYHAHEEFVEQYWNKSQNK